MFNTSGLVVALENGWARIQSLNADVPNAVILVGSGGRRAATLYGHFARDSWTQEHKEGEEKPIPVHEVLIVAEQLHRSAVEIFCTLHHEAVHGVATSREIKDCSGNRHNKKFRDLCVEMGMLPPEKSDPKLGFSAATLSAELIELYAPEIEAIEEQLKLVRRLNLSKKETKKSTWIAACGCDRKIRLPKKSIVDPKDLGIECKDCKMPFIMNEEDLEDWN